MGSNTTEIERAVARTLRDSLQKLQHTSDEVSQAVNDLVSACASARPGNALPHMIRAQTAAASLAASLDVLSRFITGALQTGWNNPPSQAEIAREEIQEQEIEQHEVMPADAIAQETEAPLVEAEPAERAELAAWGVEASEKDGAADFQAVESAEELPDPVAQIQAPADEMAQAFVDAPEPVDEAFDAAGEEVVETVLSLAAENVVPIAAEFAVAEPVPASEMSELAPVAQPISQGSLQPDIPAMSVQPEPSAEHQTFEVSTLSPEQQELHRRANRVAKVTMQDIKMLRPRDVELGKQSHDLCTRLRDDIERAHREYERRFQAILEQPVDYFYAWMVEILAEGDARLLGEYPYQSPVLQR